MSSTLDSPPIANLASGPQATYESHLAEGRFMIQRGRPSGEYVFYPKVMSPCGETEFEWIEASGNGIVYAITVNRGRDICYNVALIDLDEGPRMMSTVIGVESVPIGTRVRAKIEASTPPRVVFEPHEA